MNQDTFCSAPWFRLRIDWDGQYRPCCDFKIQKSEFSGRKNYSIHDTTVKEWMAGEYSQYLRQNLTQGVKLPECSACWRKEQHGVSSLRQTINDTVTNNHGNDLNNTWVKIFVKKHSDSYRILSADVKLSNVCNFGCIMCDPYSSSKIYDKWHNQPDNKFVQKYLKEDPVFFDKIKQNYQTQKGYQHLADLLAEPITELKMLGGEPLLDKALFQLLECQPKSKKSQIRLHFVTNGSLSLVDATNRLKDYKSVSFCVSLEGVGAIQDYARTGSNWKIIEQHVLEAIQNNIQISVHHTIQASTVLKLPELLIWCHDMKIPMSFTMLENPDYLAVSVLPSAIKEEVIHNFNNINNIKLLPADDKQTSIDILTADGVKNLIDSQPDNSKKYPEFLEYIRFYEQNLSTKLSDVCPLLSH